MRWHPRGRSLPSAPRRYTRLRQERGGRVDADADADGDVGMIWPAVFGYQQVDVTAAGLPRRCAAAHQALTSFTMAEGFALCDTFTDVRDDQGLPALDALLTATTFTDVIAVVVPDWTHLGRTPLTQDRTHSRIFGTTGLPVLAARLR